MLALGGVGLALFLHLVFDLCLSRGAGIGTAAFKQNKAPITSKRDLTIGRQSCFCGRGG